MPRKYHGPLRPGERSAKVPRSFTKKLTQTAKQQVKQIVLKNKELKSMIVQHSTLSPSTSWAYEADLMNIGEGVTSVQRNGFKIQGLRLKGRMTITSSDSSNLVRVVIFRNDRNATPSGLPGNVNGFFDDTFYQSNKLVYDKTFTFNEMVSGNGVVKHVKFSIPTKHIIEYGTASAAYPKKGGYWIACISDSGVAGHPSVNITTAFYFKEH